MMGNLATTSPRCLSRSLEPATVGFAAERAERREAIEARF
jgi:hypothetical protein